MTMRTYSIAPSDMAFHALTTSLYKDRLRAPVREILSNAIDIHRRTGNNRPIEIKLPTPLDTQFRIRDFGTGLSHQHMLGLYSSLFSSDKHLTRANEVGGFGVGAKSPFAYTDAFTVESYHNGVRTIYSAFMDGNRAPQLVELFKEKTNEPNGLAVSYPVVKTDEEQLVRVVRQEVAVCGHPVVCLGVSAQVVPLEDHPDFERLGDVWFGEDLSVVSEQSSNDNQEHNGMYTRVHARMGNVVYPIPKNDNHPEGLKAAQLLVDILLSRYESLFQVPANPESKPIRWRRAIVDVPLGSLRPAMSREELVANDLLTVQGLEEAYTHLLKHVYQRAIKTRDMAACKLLLTAHKECLLRRLGRQASICRALEPECAKLVHVIDASEKKETVWKSCAVLVHPMITYGGDSPAINTEKSRMFHQMFMPLHQPQGRHYSNKPLFGRNVVLMIVPHAHYFPDAATFIESSTGARSPEGSMTEPVKQYLTQVRQTLQNKTGGWVRDNQLSHAVVAFATSHLHERQLLDAADYLGKQLTVLDLSTTSMYTRQPYQPLKPMAAPFSTNSMDSNQDASDAPPKQWAAYRWDNDLSTIVQETLNELPDYWLAVPQLQTKRTEPFKASLKAWQARGDKQEVFYFIADNAPNAEVPSQRISVSWQHLCNRMLAPDHQPPTSFHWLLARADIPKNHPLHDERFQTYARNHRLLYTLEEVSMLGLRGQYTENMFSNAKEAIALSRHDDNTLAIAAQYPLLDAILTQEMFSMFTPYDYKSGLLDSIVQYIAFVDTVNPQAALAVKASANSEFPTSVAPEMG